MHSRKLQNGKFSDDDDVPSAPPFGGGSTEEIKEAAERSPAPSEHSTQNTTDLPGMKTTPSMKPENKSGNVKPDTFKRCVPFSALVGKENKNIC